MEIPEEVKMQSNEETLSISHLNGLLKQKRNADFKSIVTSANRSDLLNIGGNTLMHTAAASNNIEIIAFLFGSRFDINAKNTLGQTPLHLAVLNSHFQAVELLLSLDSDILLVDNKGTTSLQLCFRGGNQVPEYIITCFLKRLKRPNMSAQEIAYHLERVGCSVNQALLMNDAEVTDAMLDGRNFDFDESCALVERVMSVDYPENIRVVLTRGHRSHERVIIYIEEVQKDPTRKRYFEKLINNNVIDRLFFMTAAARTFLSGTEDEMQMFFNINIHEWAKRALDVELLTGLFGNKKVDFVRIAESRNFDVDGVGWMMGRSALHEAAAFENKAGIVYLLNRGAHPDAEDFIGRTPLFVCRHYEIAALLLSADADVQAVSFNGRTIVDDNPSDRIVADLCILESKGLLKKELADAIDDPANAMHGYDSYRRDLEWMKTRKISEVESLYAILVGDIENTARRAKSGASVEAVLKASRERVLKPIYVTMMKKKLRKANDLFKCRYKAATFLSDVMRIELPDHLVIEKIIDLFTVRELKVFDQIER